MKYLFLGLTLFLTTSSFSQSFYDVNSVQKIEIVFAESNWDQLLDQEKAATENYIMAQSVTINGQLFDSVGVKYKGNSTYKSNQIKNPIHIELDTYKDHIYEAYTDIKLSNVFNDPSFVREVLSYQILRQYMDAPLSNYANVYINGNLIGLYTNSEAISKKFVNSRFGSKTNEFFKCNPPAGAGPNTTDYPNLVYLGSDSSQYFDSYELKSNYGWNQLIELCDSLANNISQIEKILDVDRALWMLAFNNILVNLDSYSGAFAQNYYLYKDDFGRFIPVIWDLNESFGRFSMTGTINLNNTTSKQQMTHLLHENDATYPLIKQLLSNPMYKRMYLAHCKTILQENFANNNYFNYGQALQATIDADVQADANKFFTYAQFTSNLSNDITVGGGPGGGTTPGIQNLMDGRNTYLMAQSDFSQTEPSISNITLSNNSPSLNNSIFISAQIANENAVYLGYRLNSLQPFNRVLMYDDGNHGDGAANDNIYGVKVGISSSAIQYYIYAENTIIGKFSPARAEHEYHTISVIEELVINEVQASNQNTIEDPFGKFEDWIEIYNPNNSPVFLGEYYLTDDKNAPYQWQLPNETLLAKGFKLIWASGDSTSSNDHASFKVSKSGEAITLNKKGTDTEILVDYVQFGTQTSDYSYGRETDASDVWINFPIPSPNQTNIYKPLGLTENTTSFWQVYPNPFRDELTIQNLNNKYAKISIYSISGSLLYQAKLTPFQNLNWQDKFAKGLRIIKLETDSSIEIIKVVSK
jgi:hypothetical protein